MLIKEILKNKNVIVFAFQANIYCIIICKLFSIKVIARSNSAPAGWSKNIFKRLFFKFFLNLADRVMVNSIQFKSDLKKEFDIRSCVGIDKYKTTLQDNNKDDFLQHLKEELMDAALYIQKLQSNE